MTVCYFLILLAPLMHIFLDPPGGQIWNSGYPKEPEKGTCTISKARSAIQNDDADQQTPGSSSRDMGSMGCVLIKDCPSAAAHRNFEVMLFQAPPGADSNDDDYPIRLVLVGVGVVVCWGSGRDELDVMTL